MYMHHTQFKQLSPLILIIHDRYVKRWCNGAMKAAVAVVALQKKGIGHATRKKYIFDVLNDPALQCNAGQSKAAAGTPILAHFQDGTAASMLNPDFALCPQS